MLFTDVPLDDRLQRALATAGFVTPTPIQAAAMPVILAGRDLVGTAQTGTGKTAAFVLPILQRLMATPLEFRKSRAVILAPTRELVEQILAVVRQLGIHTNIRAVAVYGGVAMQPQTRALRSGVELIVACPGRLLDHMKRRNADLRQLDYLVLDEADRMLDMGFLPSIQEIIDALPDKRQTLLFSATFPQPLNALVKQTLRDPARVQVDNAVAAQTVRHTLYQVKHSMKAPLLTALLRQLIPDSDAVLIFTQTRMTANQVAKHLSDAGMDADVLHAEKTQRERQDTLNRFRAGAFPYLVATDIAARGIDVTSISHVVNFDIPSKADDYLHRIGRTGRMERAGHAISLMTRGDVRAVREIERMLGKKIVVAQLEGNDAQQMGDVIPHAPDSVMGRAPKYPGAGRPGRVRHADAAPAGAGHPPRRHHTDVPPVRGARPHTSFGPAGRPHPADGDRRRRDGRADYAPASPTADRPPRRHQTDAAPPARGVRPRPPFGNTEPTGRTPRPGADRRLHGAKSTAPPPRHARGTEPRPAEHTAPARPGKQFTGMASVAKHRRQHAADKRQPGEVPSSSRPSSRPAPAGHPYAPKHALGKKRPGVRRSH